MKKNTIKEAKYLKGDKVYLRHIKKTDLKNGWLDWVNDQESIDGLFSGFPVSEEELKNYFKLQKLPYSVMFAICKNEDGMYIGNGRLSQIDWVNKECVYGRLIGEKNLKGKGFGSEALILLLRYAFSVLGMNRVYSSAVITNKISIRSNLKIGMKKEGIFKEASYKNGKFVDRVAFAVLAKDFFKRYGK